MNTPFFPGRSPGPVEVCPVNRMKTRFVPGSSLLPALVVLATACAPVPGKVPAPLASGRQASFIVGGTAESGWPAVGALTVSMGGTTSSTTARTPSGPR